MSTSLSDRLIAHFRAAAAIAAGTVVVGSSTVQASIVYSGVVNISVPYTTQGIYLNLVTNVSNTSPGLVPGWDINIYAGFGTTLYFYNTPPHYGTVADGTFVANLAPGTVIDGSNATATVEDGENFPTSLPGGLYGFRFQDEGSGNAVRYGWARVLNANPGPYTLIEYAYENTGAGIAAGDTGQTAGCYANCDHSTALPFLNVLDFTCFLQKFAAADSYANCDGSTQTPTLNVLDFTCFLQKFAAGCSAP